jgi:hypothetical protein
MISFRKPDAQGMRYALGYRTFRSDGVWVIQRWNGENWIHVCQALTYAEAREAATQDEARLLRERGLA